MGKFVDMAGWIMKEHGIPDSKITVLRRVDDYVSPKGYRVAQWECKCECGNIFVSPGGNIRSGSAKSCGCFQKEVARNMAFKDLTGMVFGRLTVLYQADDKVEDDGTHKMMWHCSCECGNEKDILGASLSYGATTSCGCVHKEKISQLNESLREYDEDKNIVGKICCLCKRMLSIDNFYKNSRTADGYHGTCKYCSVHSFTGRYNTYKRGARSRGLDFLLSQDEFDLITQKPCYYCGEYEKRYFDEPYSGIDRVDSSKGYDIENVLPCCETCNRMKLDYNTSFWLNKMQKIIKHMKEKEDGQAKD